ncbi:MAG: hypothetical protein MRY72_13075 [Aquisalinus sp.]|nr:hypothetical protein [Aquisalinus sp.]
MVDNIDDYQKLGEITEGWDITSWQSPGPVSSAFLASTALIRVLIGPKGSGKTSTCEIAEVLNAMAMPRCFDGVRRYRTLTVRDTYRELYQTAIQSWQDWFPPNVGNWSGGQDRPAEHELKFIDDYGPVEFVMEFAALPDTGIEKWFDGKQMTGMFMNGAPSMKREILQYGLSRVGRFPPAKSLPVDYRDLINDEIKHVSMDANKTDVDHWFYDLCVTNVPLDAEIFDMPGGYDDDAENLAHLNGGRRYYDAMARNNPKWLVDIEVHNKWGPSRDGVPIYSRYNDRDHLLPNDIDVIPELDLLIGLDAGTLSGGRPSAVFGQVTPLGQAVSIDELYLGRCGPTRFFEALLGKLKVSHLRNFRNLRVWADPSAFVGADREGGEQTWVDIGEQALGVAIQAPESNELENFRLETKRVLLRTSIDEPGIQGTRYRYLVCPRCKYIRKGNNSGYRYKLDPKGQEQAKPEKNESSHPQDGEQYFHTGYFGRDLVRQSVSSRAQQGWGGTQNFGSNFDVFNI